MAELVMKYQQYAEYKDSGVEWLGEVPSHWDTKPLKYLCTYNDDVLPDSTSKVFELEYVDIGSVSSTEGITNTENMVFGNAPSRAKRIVQDGDVIVSTVRTYLEAIAPISNPPENMIVSTGFAVIRPNEHLCKGYAAYCLRAKGFIKEVVSLSVGVSYPAINATDLVGIKIPSLPFNEQAQIANFLDHETAKIDTLIEKQQTLIQLLKEKRQAVISHAVTKGLNSDAPMKDSGVEWLGEVPEHWNVGRVGYYGQVLNGSTPSKANLSYWYPKEIAWLSSGEVNQYYIESPTDYISYKALKECSVTLLPIGTLVMGMIGQGKTRGMSAVTKIETTINQNLAAVIPNDNLYSNYAHLFFQAAYKELREDARGGNQAALNCEIIRDFKITIPPINEQRTIFIEVNKISDKFDVLMEKAEQAIQLMQERRTALISAAVTGKIDVRGWRASE